MIQELVHPEQVKQFEIDTEFLIENFSDCPERVYEVMPVIRQLARMLNKRGYKPELTYDYSLGIPDSISINKVAKSSAKPKLAEDDFRDICGELGISGLFG